MKPIFEKINKPEYHSFFLEEVSKPYFPDPWHFHPEIEILYVREGSGNKFVGDSINTFSPGEIVIIGSNTPHVWSCDSKYLNPENKLMSSAICIQFMENFMGRSSSDIPEMHIILEFINFAKRGIQFEKKTRHILIKHIEELPSRIGMDRLLGLLTILHIMSTSKDIKYLSSLHYAPQETQSEDKARMEIIFQYIFQKYKDMICLEEIASLINLTPPSFCRYFKSRTNKVFSSVVTEVRIGHACKLLIEDKYTIAQVCFESGFNQISHFNRQFKKIKGMTPSQFQRKYKTKKFNVMSDK